MVRNLSRFSHFSHTLSWSVYLPGLCPVVASSSLCLYGRFACLRRKTCARPESLSSLNGDRLYIFLICISSLRLHLFLVCISSWSVSRHCVSVSSSVWSICVSDLFVYLEFRVFSGYSVPRISSAPTFLSTSNFVSALSFLSASNLCASVKIRSSHENREMHEHKNTGSCGWPKSTSSSCVCVFVCSCVRVRSARRSRTWIAWSSCRVSCSICPAVPGKSSCSLCRCSRLCLRPARKSILSTMSTPG